MIAVFRKKIFLLIIAAFPLSLSACAPPPEDRTFHQQYIEVAYDIAHILMQHGICKSELDCSSVRKKLFFVGPLYGGFQFLSYQIKDPEILGEIKNVIVKKFNERPEIKHVRIREYRESWEYHHLEHHFFEPDDLIYEDDLRRD